jgi:hypothetical protein
MSDLVAGALYLLQSPLQLCAAMAAESQMLAKHTFISRYLPPTFLINRILTLFDL